MKRARISRPAPTRAEWTGILRGSPFENSHDVCKADFLWRPGQSITTTWTGDTFGKPGRGSLAE